MTLGEAFATLSIRHLAPLAAGAFAFGCEETVRDGLARPLVGLLDADRRPRFVDSPPGGWASFAGSIGEVAADETGRVIAATAPRAGLCALWEAASGRCLAVVRPGRLLRPRRARRRFRGLLRPRRHRRHRRRPGPSSLVSARLGFDNHLAVA